MTAREIEAAILADLRAQGMPPRDLPNVRALAVGLAVVVAAVTTRPAPAVPEVPAWSPSPGSVWLGLPGGRAIRLDEGDDETLLRELPGARDGFDALDRLNVARERILRAPLGGRPR